MSKNNHNSSRGFTLIEVLIATAILVLVGVGVIAVEKQFMGSGTTSKHRLQATMLAQEGINMVRQIFTTNLMFHPVDQTNIWAYLGESGDATPPFSTNTYYWNSDDNQVVACSVDNPTCLTGITTDDWVVPQDNILFFRKVKYSGGTSPLVTVTVSWSEGARTETVELKTRLKDTR